VVAPRRSLRDLLDHRDATSLPSMGFLDDAKKLIDENDDKVDRAIEKAGDLVDDRTDGKYADKVDQAQVVAQEKTGDGDTTA
jgi:hypothetical protein